MKIKPPANEAERLALKQRLERQHGGRVDIYEDRYGWTVRFCQSRKPRKRPGPSGQ